jgi:6-phosphogluconolactonase
VLHPAVDAEAAARQAAALIAAEAREAVRRRGCFAVALSGGATPLRLWRLLAGQELPWPQVHLAQVDERLAPAGDAARNLTALRETLLRQVPLPPENVYPMPVEAPDPALAAREYGALLQRRIGSRVVFDLVHLGLGEDGHTASLLPGDAALDVIGRDVALTGTYQGWRRMTLTYPALDRARRILWLVTGAGKAAALRRLFDADRSIPAGRVRRSGAVVVADAAALAHGDIP